MCQANKSAVATVWANEQLKERHGDLPRDNRCVSLGKPCDPCERLRSMSSSLTVANEAYSRQSKQSELMRTGY